MTRVPSDPTLLASAVLLFESAWVLFWDQLVARLSLWDVLTTSGFAESFCFLVFGLLWCVPEDDGEGDVRHDSPAASRRRRV
jgi:hypothetical protein